MSIWAELKRVVNDNFSYPLNKQNFYPTNFGTNAEWFEASTTYVAPQTGVYIVTCVGKGGNARSTPEYGYDSSRTSIFVSTGGGGAVCKGYVFLQAGQVVYITIDASQSNFGNLIAAGAGQPGIYDYNNPVSAVAGGSVLIAGNIFNHNGYPGIAGNLLDSDLAGGNAGLITPWSLNENWSRGYLPFINWTEITGGDSESYGKFGGGHGGADPYGRGGVRGGGGYGGGGNYNELMDVSGRTVRYTSYSQGGKGLVLVEHGTMIYG